MAFPKGAFIKHVETGTEYVVKHGPDECSVYPTMEPGYCVGAPALGRALVIPASEIEAEGAYRQCGFHWDRPVPKKAGVS